VLFISQPQLPRLSGLPPHPPPQDKQWITNVLGGGGGGYWRSAVPGHCSSSSSIPYPPPPKPLRLLVSVSVSVPPLLPHPFPSLRCGFADHASSLLFLVIVALFMPPLPPSPLPHQSPASSPPTNNPTRQLLMECRSDECLKVYLLQ